MPGMMDLEILKEIAAIEEIPVTEDDIMMFFNNRCWLVFQRQIARLLDEGQTYLEDRDASIEMIKYGAGMIKSARTLLRFERTTREQVTRRKLSKVTLDQETRLGKNEQKLLDLLESLDVS